MAIKGIIFDLDGTLVDTLDDLTDSMNAVLTQLGCPKCTRNQCREMIGNGLRKFAERALGPDYIQHTDKLLAGMVEYYRGHCLLKTVPYPGMKNVIAALSKQGIRLSVLTNKNQQPAEVITRHYFGEVAFDPIIGAADERKVKPDPQTTLDIISRWGLTADEVLFVGDSEADAQTAAAAGVKFIGCKWGFRSREQLVAAGAEILIDKPERILDLAEITSTEKMCEL